MTYLEFVQAQKKMNPFFLPNEDREKLKIDGENFKVEILRYNVDLFERMIFIIDFCRYKISIIQKKNFFIFEVINYCIEKDNSCYDKGTIDFKVNDSKTIRENLIDFFEILGFNRKNFILSRPAQLSFLSINEEGREEIVK